MHWFADLMTAIGVVLNGIPQGDYGDGTRVCGFPHHLFIFTCCRN